MENYPLPANAPRDEQEQVSVTYPPKYRMQANPANVWLRSIVSLGAYLLLGYYIFPSYKMLLIITAIVVVHELGHFLAMKYYKYNELGIFFIPLLGAYVSGTKREVSQRQSAVIILAGPLPGIIIGIALVLIDRSSANGYYPFNVELSQIGWFAIMLNLLNLLPVYPLDGGQLLNRVFLDEEGLVSRIFVYISVGLMCWLIYKSGFYPLLILPLMILLRLRGDTQFNAVDKRIEQEGINADTSYDDLPDRDYWEIRNILVEEHPAFRDVPKSPPYEFHQKEEKIMTTIQSLLHRHLIQDMTMAGKVLLFLIWGAALALPWLLKLDMGFFSRFGF